MSVNKDQGTASRIAGYIVEFSGRVRYMENYRVDMLQVRLIGH